MQTEVLAQGREPTRPPLTLRRVVRSLGRGGCVVLVAAVAVLGCGVLALAYIAPPAAPSASVTSARPLPRVVLSQARVSEVAAAKDGALDVAVQLQGLPGLLLLSLRVELPGSVVVLEPLPDALSPDGAATVRFAMLPVCPTAVEGLAQGALVAVVRRAGGPVREARVRLDPSVALPAAIRVRCGTPAAGLLAPGLVVAPGGPAPGGALRTEVLLAAPGPEPVTLLAVAPGPGLSADTAAALPLVLIPGAAPVRLVVDLQPKGCGGAPDTPPFLLVLGGGDTVAPSVLPPLQGALDELRPYRCTAP